MNKYYYEEALANTKKYLSKHKGRLSFYKEDRGLVFLLWENMTRNIKNMEFYGKICYNKIVCI